jgi:hypothetical protein
MSDDSRTDRSDPSDLERQEKSNDDPADEPAKGPSLTLLYSLIALALAAAIALAALIVRPFYLRH